MSKSSGGGEAMDGRRGERVREEANVGKRHDLDKNPSELDSCRENKGFTVVCGAGVQVQGCSERYIISAAWECSSR